MITSRDLTSLNDLEYDNDVHYLKTSCEEVFELMLYLKEHLSMTKLVDIFVIDRLKLQKDNRFCLNYLLKNLEFNKYICVQLEFDTPNKIESISFIWPNAFFWESEILNHYNIQFNFELPPNEFSGLMRKDFYKSKVELQTQDLNESNSTLKLKPSHYLQQNELELELSLQDDVIQECKINTGFQFRGIEKSCENLTSEHLMTFSDKWNPNKSLFFNVLCSDTFERMLSIQVTERAMAIRMIMMELNRIMEHCYTIAMICYEMKFSKYYSEMMIYLEKIRGLVRFYCGEDISTSFSCIGGVRYEIPQGWASTCINLLDSIEQGIIDFNKVIQSSSIWNEILLVGKISSLQALEYGISGPSLRASGINYDLRKKSLKYFYKDVDFETPVGQEGFVLDRYLVRIEEIFQSIKIIMQVLDNLPSGKIISSDSLSFRSFKDKDNIFNEQKYIDVITKEINIPNSQIYNSLESSEGEIGLHIVGDGGNKPLRFKLYSSATNTFSLYPKVMDGLDYQDALLILASLNINMKEVER